MPAFGQRSMTALMSCERDIQTILHEAIKFYDFSVIHGHRSPELQFELYQKGRKLVGKKWVEDENSKSQLSPIKMVL